MSLPSQEQFLAGHLHACTPSAVFLCTICQAGDEEGNDVVRVDHPSGSGCYFHSHCCYLWFSMAGEVTEQRRAASQCPNDRTDLFVPAPPEPDDDVFSGSSAEPAFIVGSTQWAQATINHTNDVLQELIQEGMLLMTEEKYRRIRAHLVLLQGLLGDVEVPENVGQVGGAQDMRRHVQEINRQIADILSEIDFSESE